MIKKNLIYVLFLLLLCSVSFASTSWTNYGNSGYNYGGGVFNLLFSSPYLDGNLNLTGYTDSLTNSYRPILMNPLNISSSNSVYIYTFTKSTISVYSGEDLSLISTNSFDILGQPIIFNLYSSSSRQIAFVSGTQPNLYINFIEMTPSNTLVSVLNVPISNKTTGIIESGEPVENSYLAHLLNNGSIELIFPLSPSLNTSFDALIGTGSDETFTNSSLTIGGSRPLFVHDLNSDTFQDIVYATYNNSDVYLSVADGQTGAICTNDIASNNVMDNIYVSTAQIGSSTGSKEIVVTAYHNGGNRGDLMVFDYSCALLYDNPHFLNSPESHISNAVVSDINYDGYNELCFMNTTTYFQCLDTSYNTILYIDLDSNGDQYISMAEYDNNNTYMEIIKKDGVYKILNYSTYEKLYNFTYLENDTMVYTNSLQSTLNFTKDIFLFNQNKMSAYLSFGIPITCGDGVCSFGETLITCPVDCQVETEEDNNLLGIGEKCINASQCDSGKCFYMHCELKTTGELCDNDDQCVSNDCNNMGKCNKASFFQVFNAGKNETLGDDDNTNNIVSFIIMFFAAAFGVILGAMAKSGIGSMILGSGFFYTSAFFCAIIGWLSPFILVGLILLLVVIMALIFTMGMR